MAGKKLPKAITITADEMRASGAVTPVPELKVVSAHAPRGAVEPRAVEPAQVTVIPPGETIDAPAKMAAKTATKTPVAPDAAHRREWAQDIVQRHAAYSVVGGIVPLPLVNAASVTAINLRMVKVLSELYGVPFVRDRARAVIIALMGGIMPTGVGALTTATLLYIIPGSSLIGLAMSSVTAAACTRGIGRIFVEHFESGAMTLDVPAQR